MNKGVARPGWPCILKDLLIFFLFDFFFSGNKNIVNVFVQTFKLLSYNTGLKFQILEDVQELSKSSSLNLQNQYAALHECK